MITLVPGLPGSLERKLGSKGSSDRLVFILLLGHLPSMVQFLKICMRVLIFCNNVTNRFLDREELASSSSFLTLKKVKNFWGFLPKLNQILTPDISTSVTESLDMALINFF